MATLVTTICRVAQDVVDIHRKAAEEEVMGHTNHKWDTIHLDPITAQSPTNRAVDRIWAISSTITAKDEGYTKSLTPPIR